MIDEQKRRLARAWQAIAGWSLGMQLQGLGLGFSRGGVVVQLDSDGLVWVRHEDGREYVWSPESHRCIPDLDAPANQWHWFAWTLYTFRDVSLKRSGTWWSAESRSELTAEHSTPAAALLELYCRHLEDEAHELAREWWKHERQQEEGGEQC